MRRVAVLVLAVAASCGDGGTGTTNATVATTAAPGTSAATTSPPAPTTTPSTTVATTITAPPAGPAVATSSSCVLGWWDDGWFSVSEAVEPPVAPGDPLQVATPNGVFEAAVTAIHPYDDVGSPAWSLEVVPGLDFGVATAGAWDPVPYPVVFTASSGDVYVEQAALIMSQRGYPDAAVELAQVIRTDLEGDGVDEVIVVARHPDAPAFSQEVGVFSLVFLRRLVEGEVATAILHHSIFTAEDIGLATSVENAEVSAVADLNGDGKMEIALDGYGYEWYWSEVFEYVDDDLGSVSVMECGGGV